MSPWRLKCSGACFPSTRPSVRRRCWPPSACPPGASAATTTTSSTSATSGSASRSRTSPARASPRRSSWPSCKPRCRIVAAEGGTSLPELAAKMNGFLHRSTRLEQLRDVLLRPARRAQPTAALRQRRAQSAVPAAPGGLSDAGSSDAATGDPRAHDRGHGAGPLPADDLRGGDRPTAVRRRARRLHRWRDRSAERQPRRSSARSG